MQAPAGTPLASVCRTCKGSRQVTVKTNDGEKTARCPACKGTGKGYATK
jgi:hypothetical protein